MSVSGSEQSNPAGYETELLRGNHSGIKLLAILAGGFFLLLVAVMLVPSVLNVDYMFTMGAVLVFLPVASAIFAVASSRGLSAERQPVDPVVEGAAREVRVIVSQRVPTMLTVEALESLPAGIESDPPMPVALHLYGSGCEFQYSVVAAKRGLYPIPPPRLRIIDPLGVTSLVRRGNAGSELVVYPKPLPLQTWNLVSSAAPVGWLADALARPAGGASAEFYGTREYHPGDDLRRVHWRSVARVGQLIVKEFTDEVDARELVIALDTESGTDEFDGLEGPLDYGTRVAAYLAQASLAHGARAVLATAAVPGGFAACAEDLSQLPLVLERLARARADSGLPLSHVLSLLDDQIHRGVVVVMIGPKVDEALRSVAARLQSRGAKIAQVYVDPVSFRAAPSKVSGDVPGQASSSQSARFSSERDLDRPPDLRAEYLLDERIPCWRIERGGVS